MPSPNIVLFIADQLRADHLGCYGNDVVRTPHIDALAGRGVRFDQFHAASTVCMPNRATLLTGRMPTLHGVRRNGIPLSLAHNTFVETLCHSGYRTALIGKAHFQHYGMFVRKSVDGEEEAYRYPGSAEDYENELIERWQNDPDHAVKLPYYGFEHVELCLYHGDGVEGDYARWLHAKAPDIAQRRGARHARSDERYICRDAWRTQVPEALHSSAYIAERSEAWLQAQAARADEPFFLMCSFPDPHHPFCPPGRYWDMYDPQEVKLPPTFHDRSRSPLIEYIHRATGDGQVLPNNHHPYAPSEREAREAIALTYGAISNLDAAVGRVVGALTRAGLADNTIVAFTSDHGDFMGDHGVMLKGPLHFSGLTRVPFIWAEPGGETPSVVSAPFGTIDIARTVLDTADVAPYNGMQGNSMRPALSGGDIEAAGVLIENESAQLRFGRPAPYKLRTLVVDGWRITFSNDAELCELYDLRADPHERVNLWTDDEARPMREALLRRLMTAMLEYADESPAPLASG